MASKLDIIKTLFDDFIHETQKSNVSGLDKNQKSNLNASVFDFQAHVFQALNKQALNLNLNPKFISENIKKSFGSDCKAFTAFDYCFSFFDFLCVNKESTKELYELIYDYLEVHKEELNWKDIFIMSSGVTRCTANLRFALNELRKWNFIKTKDRNFQPSEFGEMVFYLYRINKDLTIFDDTKSKKEQPKHNPIEEPKLKIVKMPYYELFSFIEKFKYKEKEEPSLIEIYQIHKNWKPNSNEVREIEKNIDYFLKNSKLTNDGIKRINFL